MLKCYQRTKKYLLISALCISSCAVTGCIESSFNLANESRLPRGMAIPPGLTRADVSVTLDYIGMSRATFTLRDKTGKKLTTVTGKTKGNPIYLKTTTRGPDPRDPSYQLVVINSVTEIMEQRRPEPILYITDDPAVRKEILERMARHSHSTRKMGHQAERQPQALQFPTITTMTCYSEPRFCSAPLRTTN